MMGTAPKRQTSGGEASNPPKKTPGQKRIKASAAMASSLQPTAYRMHVSQRYLDLTRQKLELIRLPREPESAQSIHWDLGVSKPLLESVIDHWMEHYSWRDQEAFYNERLSQFRLPVNRTRLHFVHKISQSPTAVPLLFVTAWPESFLNVTQVIDALTEPGLNHSSGAHRVPSFHVVAPSIPGSGFSDTVSEESNNMQSTAATLDSLMKALGYKQYIAHGAGWAFKICRILALQHSDSCIAVHTVDPEMPAPPNLVYGHSPGMPPAAMSPSTSQPSLTRPQTVSYGLTDSPAGLLAYMLDAIRPPQPISLAMTRLVLQPPSTPATERSSPRSTTTAASTPAAGSASATQPSSPQSSPGADLATAAHVPWSAANLVTWTMIYWLPGPEVSLRWIANSSRIENTLWVTTSHVPLGITQFHDLSSPSGAAAAALGQQQSQLAEMYHRVVMVRRREGKVRCAAWERPQEVVSDIRELANIIAALSLNGLGTAPVSGGITTVPSMPGMSWQP